MRDTKTMFRSLTRPTIHTEEHMRVQYEPEYAEHQQKMRPSLFFVPDDQSALTRIANVRLDALMRRLGLACLLLALILPVMAEAQSTKYAVWGDDMDDYIQMLPLTSECPPTDCDGGFGTPTVLVGMTRAFGYAEYFRSFYGFMLDGVGGSIVDSVKLMLTVIVRTGTDSATVGMTKLKIYGGDACFFPPLCDGLLGCYDSSACATQLVTDVAVPASGDSLLITLPTTAVTPGAGHCLHLRIVSTVEGNVCAQPSSGVRSNYVGFAAAEHATVGYRPRLYVWTSTPAEGRKRTQGEIKSDAIDIQPVKKLRQGG